ncbi:S26 family signal peptidase [Limnoglobus roseus]|uniref:Signal peptidase I n=1 Tax=Limnoglobus roseus TaxID=2598579 RepID=A0A5C1A4W8_9BACT|nr:S26 family signal peptidase [Limnoglobus roseus]QEL13383.1 S26 family signal peptidase [Limnoglobus roseus]
MAVPTNASSTANPPAPAKPPEKKHARDSIRESLETIVFVVVLVFLLKQFVVEAFVIPTGSMAETLYGYQKNIKCAECEFEFPLNSSREVEGDPNMNGARRAIHGYCCPNCRYKHVFKQNEPLPYNSSGDRVLVHKAQYHQFPPQRGDVVVFKYPAEPQRQLGAQNYIKRLWGLGGETLAMWRGDIYVCDTLTYPPDVDRDGQTPRPEELWKFEYTHAGTTETDAAVQRFEQSRAAGFADPGGFRLVRKNDAMLEAMKRSVWDNDHQSNYLANAGVPPRWKAETDDWTNDNASMPKAFTHTGAGLGWLRYRHLVVENFNALGGGPGKPVVKPKPVDNFLGYNGEVDDMNIGGFSSPEFVLERQDYKFWVGDLIAECQAKFTDPNAEVTLELSKGPNRFQARFAGGNVTLTRTGENGKELATKPTGITGGTHKLRFANVDCSLRVWVDGRKVDFGTAGEYDPGLPAKFEFDAADEKKEGWTVKNDVDAPASIGASNGVEVSKLKLWRDTFYINMQSGARGGAYDSLSNVTGTVYTYYVHPGHYMCFGDNSAQSSDGREWGTVPERLMLGKASFVFFPLDRIGFIK